MAVNINVPSQVKTYANLAAFPATGALKTIYIAEDTNKTYRWTGSVYVEVSASAASGITIGSTAIASGTVGRILFEGAGNVVQESSSLFWDSTNNRLGIGTSTPSFPLDVVGASRISGTLTTGGGTPLVLTGESFAFQTVVASGAGGSVFGTNSANPSFIDILSGSNFWHISNRSTTMGNRLGFFNANFTGTTATYTNELFTINTNGNIGINTTFDAGFKLDVNGTARVQNSATTATAFTATNTLAGGIAATFSTANGGSVQFTNGYIESTALQFRISTGSTQPFVLMTQGTERMRLAPTTGNVLINTTTDAGFRLDVNGTARVSSTGNVLTINDSSNSRNFTFNPSYATSTYGGFFNHSTGNITLGASLGTDNGSNLGIFLGGPSGNRNASALLQIDSTSRGFLPPRMTTTQKNAIATPAAGLVVYDTTLNKLCVYTTAWETVTSL